MPANKEQKQAIIEQVTEKVKSCKSMILVDYKGLTVKEDTALRNALRKVNVEYKVLKNTLVKKSLNELGITEFDADLNGPTAVAFGSDEVSAAKVLVEQVKELKDKIKLKSAYVDGAYVDINGINTLASMPTKEELIAKMLGSMQAPISNFVGVLSATMRGLVVALNGVAEKKAEA